MKEEFKITGKGQLHGKDFGTIKIDDEEILVKELTEPNKSIIYDSKLNQYCVDGQWKIPFDEYDSNMETMFNKLLCEIKTLKNFFVEKQKFEPASKTRDMEKTLSWIKIQIKELEEERLRC